MQIIKKHQNILDFTTQHAGTVTSLFVTAIANGIGITEDVAAGSLLMVAPADLKVVADLKSNKVDVISFMPPGGIFFGGIGYMKIGTSFKVS